MRHPAQFRRLPASLALVALAACGPAPEVGHPGADQVAPGRYPALLQPEALAAAIAPAGTGTPEALDTLEVRAAALRRRAAALTAATPG